MADLDRDPAGRGPVALPMGGSRNRWVTMTYEWHSDFEDAAVNVRMRRGFGHGRLDADWLAQVHRHDLGWVWAR